MWHKAEWMGRPMRLEFTRVGLLVKLANRYTTTSSILVAYTCISMCMYLYIAFFHSLFINIYFSLFQSIPPLPLSLIHPFSPSFSLCLSIDQSI